VVVLAQDSTLRVGGKFEIRTTLTTARWKNWSRPFKDTSLQTLFHAVFPLLQAFPARYFSGIAIKG